jgi:hypothetical protein
MLLHQLAPSRDQPGPLRVQDDDMERIRRTLFAPGNLAQPYHSINTDINKRIRFLEVEG